MGCVFDFFQSVSAGNLLEKKEEIWPSHTKQAPITTEQVPDCLSWNVIWIEYRLQTGMVWRAPLMNVLFWDWCYFYIIFSCRDMSGDVWNRPSGSSVVDIGSHQTLWSLPLPNVTWHSGTWPYTVPYSTDQTFH